MCQRMISVCVIGTRRIWEYYYIGSGDQDVHFIVSVALNINFKLAADEWGLVLYGSW